MYGGACCASRTWWLKRFSSRPTVSSLVSGSTGANVTAADVVGDAAPATTLVRAAVAGGAWTSAGRREDMAAVERVLVQTDAGPMNRERWRSPMRVPAVEDDLSLL